MKKYRVSVQLIETFEIEAECENDAIDEAITKATDEGEWCIETERIDLPENVRDYNRGEIIVGDKVKFKGSNRIFLKILSEDNNEDQFMDLETTRIINASNILRNHYPFNFYTKDDDDDFLGVELIERREKGD